ncbi:MAG: lipopolysaccharide heptosyltransferase II [Nitrospinales bacterium]
MRAPSRPLKERTFHNILLWMPNWIGDVIFVLPTIHSLHRRLPHAKITTVVKAPSDELLTGHPAIDTVIKIPYGKKSGILRKIRFARSLRGYNFDLGVVFPNSFRSAFMLYLSGTETRLGYNTEGRGFLLTHSLCASKASKTEYRADYFFKILSLLELPGMEARLQPYICNDADRSVGEEFSRMKIRAQDFVVAIHPGGSKAPRTWHVERFGILCQKLIKEYKAKILLLGSESDAGIIEQIMQFCPPNTVFSLRDMDLKQSAAAIKKSKLFIGNDSGMMHLASITGTPLVGIFGPGHPATTGPFIESRKQAIVTKSYPCSPCKQKFFKECKPSIHNKPYCIEDISVKDVIGGVEKVMGGAIGTE